MNILIKNGTIVSPENTIYADVLIREGLIDSIGEKIEPLFKPDEIIDANGCFLFPGAIDPHVHLSLPGPAGFSCDDFLSGSEAALYGGTTSLFDFVTPQRGRSIFQALLDRKHEASASLIDYKFHVSPVEWLPGTAYEIERCYHEEGVRSFKVYMAYQSHIGINNGAILQVMKTVGRLGGIVTVHCEMGNEIEIFRNNFARLGKLSAKYHSFSRPPEMEAMAVKRAIDIASKTDCPLYIVHVSSKASLSHIRKAQSALQPVYAETCPQYLLLNDKQNKGNFEQIAPYVMSPPLRKKTDNDALWQAIADGTIQTVGTDHCPFTLEQKMLGATDFRKIPNGAGGIEHRLELLYTYGVLQNKISLNRFVDLVCVQPAKLFGLYPRKGTITKGAEADLVVWDPGTEREISVKTHHQKADLNIFEGFKIRGQAKYVLSKGQIAIKNGQLIHRPQGFYLF